MYVYLYIHYIHVAYKYKPFVHTDRKGETAQVNVSCRRANKPRGVLSDAAMLLHKQTQMFAELCNISTGRIPEECIYITNAYAHI